MVRIQAVIPKRLGHIWVGPYMPPDAWMKTWTEKHSDWEYRIFDNGYLNSRRWRLQKHIDEYMRRGAYSGVSDMMRYEILHENGGFIAPSDSVCINAVDDLFIEKKAYAVYENEVVRGDLMTPFMASQPDNKAIEAIIECIHNHDPKKLGHAYLSTGNYLVGKIAHQFPEDVIVLPSYTFNPKHMIGLEYKGEGKIYAEEFFGTGCNLYKKKPGNFIYNYIERKKEKKIKKIFWNAVNNAVYQPYTDEDIQNAKSKVDRFL